MFNPDIASGYGATHNYIFDPCFENTWNFIHRKLGGKKAQVADVALAALALPAEAACNLADTALGLVAFGGAMLTGGSSQKLNKFAREHLLGGGCALHSLAKWPAAVLGRGDTKVALVDKAFNKMIKLTTSQWTESIVNRAEAWAKQDSFLERHIFSRAAFLGSAIAAVALGVADVALAALASAGALLTCFQHKATREKALVSLTKVGVLPAAIGITLLRSINPRAKY